MCAEKCGKTHKMQSNINAPQRTTHRVLHITYDAQIHVTNNIVCN